MSYLNINKITEHNTSSRPLVHCNKQQRADKVGVKDADMSKNTINDFFREVQIVLLY